MNIEDLKKLKEKLERERLANQLATQKFVICASPEDKFYCNEERTLKEYEQLENTEEFVKQIETMIENVTIELVNNGVKFNKIELISEVGCLCTPLLKNLLSKKNNEMGNSLNGSWYETLFSVVRENEIDLKSNISSKYVPLVFKLKTDRIGNLDKQLIDAGCNATEYFSNNIPDKIYGIVDFDKFVVLMMSLGYDFNISNESCELGGLKSVNSKLSYFDNYLAMIMRTSRELMSMGKNRSVRRIIGSENISSTLVLSADFKKEYEPKTLMKK